jgi:heparan-alpha-glucosaminide N-acetyltransferase
MVKLRDNKTENAKPAKEVRLASVDAVRGVTLTLFLSGGFGVREMLNDPRWDWITSQTAHRAWDGCTIWSLLLPAMLFCVGVSMPYSYANRQAKGQGWPWQFLHAGLRTLVLLVISIYLDSYDRGRIVLDVRSDLAQIALAYFLAFLIFPLGKAAQGVTVAFLLIGHTTAHVLYAFAGGHELWSPTQNIDTALDGLLRFAPDAPHHVTLSVAASTAVVLCGTLVGGLLQSGIVPGVKIALITGLSFVLIFLGWALSGGGGIVDVTWFAVIPMIRALGTWTYVMTTLGWTLLGFTYFYLLTDAFGLQFWTLPLAIFGRNPLFMYVGYRLFQPWAARTAGLVLPMTPPILATLRPLLVTVLVLLIFWLIGFWLYRRRIFFKV